MTLITECGIKLTLLMDYAETILMGFCPSKFRWQYDKTCLFSKKNVFTFIDLPVKCGKFGAFLRSITEMVLCSCKMVCKESEKKF